MREHLKFDQKTKERLLTSDALKINVETRKILEEKNISMLEEAREKYEQGIILESDFIDLENTFAFEKEK